MDPGNVSAIISAVAGLAGVLTGALTTFLKERRAEQIKDKREASYLAILVVSHLDRFASGCLDVARDDGTEYGLPAGGDGRYQETVRPPEFKPLEIDVEWKVLPKDLMYGIFQISEKQERIHNRLAGIAEYDDDPFDRGEYFWVRQHDYAELGLHVSAIAEKLRKHAEMPIDESLSGEWSRDVALREVIERVCAERSAYEKRIAATSTLPSATDANQVTATG